MRSSRRRNSTRRSSAAGVARRSWIARLSASVDPAVAARRQPDEEPFDDRAVEVEQQPLAREEAGTCRIVSGRRQSRRDIAVGEIDRDVANVVAHDAEPRSRGRLSAWVSGRSSSKNVTFRAAEAQRVSVVARTDDHDLRNVGRDRVGHLRVEEALSALAGGGTCPRRHRARVPSCPSGSARPRGRRSAAPRPRHRHPRARGGSSSSAPVPRPGPFATPACPGFCPGRRLLRGRGRGRVLGAAVGGDLAVAELERDFVVKRTTPNTSVSSARMTGTEQNQRVDGLRRVAILMTVGAAALGACVPRRAGRDSDRQLPTRRPRRPRRRRLG